MVQEEPYDLERPKTPTQFDIFDQVFINSSPPNETTLWVANELLNSIIQARIDITTPVHLYIKKLTARTKQLQAQSIVYQYNANNLRSIIKKYMTYMKGKRVVLKGHIGYSRSIRWQLAALN